MCEYTPGPWEARDVAGAGLQIYAALAEVDGKILSFFHLPREQDISFHVGEDGVLYAMLAYEEWVQFSPAGWENRQAANAHLMAAAPELLQALKEMYPPGTPSHNIACPFIRHADPGSCNCRKGRAHAAIAKAEGRTEVRSC